MSNEVFIRMLNMSLTGSIVILAVMVLRLLLRRAPKLVSYCLWAVVLFRLLCPVSFSLPFSLLGIIDAPAARQGAVSYIPENIFATTGTPVELPIPASVGGDVSTTVSAILPESVGGTMGGSQDFPERAAVVASYVWFVGVALMLLYSIVSLILFGRKLSCSSRAEQPGETPGAAQRYRMYYSQDLPTAFVMGVIRPKIFLPEGLTAEEKKYVLLHEEIHIRRWDPVIRILSWFTLCLHWFNPLVWAAFFLSGRDMEMSCDEAVLRKLGSEAKKNYSAFLLNLAAGRRILGGVPLAFGEGDTGSRIRNVLLYKKTAIGLVCAVTTVTLAAAVFLLANTIEEPLLYEPMGLWGTQIKNLQWGMRPEEVEAYYAFSGPAEHWTDISLVRHLEETMELYGCEMSVSVHFEDGLGLKKVYAQLVDENQLGQLAANMQDKLADYMTSYDREKGMNWAADRISEFYSYEQLEEAQRLVNGELLATELLVKGLYFNRYVVEVSLNFTEPDERPTLCLDATGLDRMNALFAAYERELVYRQIAIDGKTLVWGMSEAEVTELLGEPDEVDRDSSRNQVVLSYSEPVKTAFGTSEGVQIQVLDGQYQDLNGQSYSPGMNVVYFFFNEPNKEEVLARLEKEYGTLSEPVDASGVSTWEKDEIPFFIDNYYLEDALTEDLYQGIQGKMMDLIYLNNGQIRHSLPNTSLIYFQFRGSKEEGNPFGVMVCADYLCLKNEALRSGN